MVILDVEIPLSPPSVNTYWGFNKSRRYLTPLANRFVKDIANWVKPKMSDKRLKLEVVFNYPDKRVRDLDNNLFGASHTGVKHSTKILSGRLNLWATQLNIVASIEVQAHLGSIEVVKFDSMLMQLFARCQPSQIGFYAGAKMV